MTKPLKSKQKFALSKNQNSKLYRLNRFCLKKRHKHLEDSISLFTSDLEVGNMNDEPLEEALSMSTSFTHSVCTNLVVPFLLNGPI